METPQHTMHLVAQLVGSPTLLVSGVEYRLKEGLSLSEGECVAGLKTRGNEPEKSVHPSQIYFSRFC